MSATFAHYAGGTHRVKSSAIRELFALLGRPDVISLAGGFPSESALDLEGLRDATRRAMAQSCGTAFQYGSSEGYLPLREIIAQRARERGVQLDASQVVLTTGSQQAIDLIARVLVDPGDRVAIEAPTYLGALQVFRFQGADLLSVPTDEGGICPDKLEEVVERHRPKLLYLIPNFANPTGSVLALRRRKAILALAARRGFFVVEDDAYGELYFRDPPPPSLFALANDEERQWVVHISSFSKSLAPGLRLAWLSAQPALLDRAVVVKQLSDTHAATLSQLVAFHYMNAGSMEPALSRMRMFYERQACAMQRAISEGFDPTSFKATMPQGGMFFWAEVPGLDTEALLAQAVQRGVAFVPGAPFYAGEPERNRLRLSFASATTEQISEGIRRLRDCIHAEFKRIADRGASTEPK